MSKTLSVVAIFAPGATVNHIEGFEVTEKYVIEPPQEVKGALLRR